MKIRQSKIIWKVEHWNIAINCAALVFKIGSSQVSGFGVERDTVTDDEVLPPTCKRIQRRSSLHNILEKMQKPSRSLSLRVVGREKQESEFNLCASKSRIPGNALSAALHQQTLSYTHTNTRTHKHTHKYTYLNCIRSTHSKFQHNLIEQHNLIDSFKNARVVCGNYCHNAFHRNLFLQNNRILQCSKCVLFQKKMDAAMWRRQYLRRSSWFVRFTKTDSM